MSTTVCGTYSFGTDSGIQSKSISKNIKWRTLGNWQNGKYTVKCKVCSNVQVNHSVSYFGGTDSFNTPSPVLNGDSIFYLSSHQVQYSRDSMVVETFNWTESPLGNLCTTGSPEWEPTLAGTCCFGLQGCF